MRGDEETPVRVMEKKKKLTKGGWVRGDNPYTKDMPRASGLYCITVGEADRGNSYHGKAVDIKERMKQHFYRAFGKHKSRKNPTGCCPLLYSAIREARAAGEPISVKVVHESKDPEEMDRMEKNLIRERSLWPRGLNLRIGGGGGGHIDLAARAKRRKKEEKKREHRRRLWTRCDYHHINSTLKNRNVSSLKV